MAETDAEFQRIGEQFRSTVEAVVAPVLYDRKHGIRAMYMDPTIEAEREIRFQGDTISFIKRLGSTGIQGVGHFDFTPSHTIEIVARDNFFGDTKSQTMFGVHENGRIARSHLVHTAIFFASVVRELDLEESQAIVDYASAPHVHYAKRRLALRLLPSEQESILETSRRDQERHTVLQRDLDAIEQARRRARESSRHHLIH